MPVLLKCLVGLSAVVVFLSLIVALFPDNIFLPPYQTCSGDSSTVRVFTSDILSKFKGQGFFTPLLLVVLGDVFDVSDGRRFYAEGEGYHGFVGQDNSRAFATGKFSEINDSVIDMGVDDVKSVVGWLRFYHKHNEYRWVGVVTGRYYSCDGLPTAEREAVLAKALDKKEMSKDELLLQRQQFCHIATNESHTSLTCHQGRYPRLLKYSSGAAGGCICPDDVGLAEFKASPMMSLEEYAACDTISSVCYIPLES